MAASIESVRVIPTRRRPVRRYSQWIAGLIALFLVAIFVKAFVTSSSVDWSLIGRYLFNHLILSGVGVTIEVTIIAEVGAIILGIISALFRLSSNPVLRVISTAYVGLFRAIPLLVILIFIFNLSFLFPRLGIGIPFTSLNVSGSTNHLISGFSAAIVGLSIAEGAYVSEIIRAGILSVDQGQSDAGAAIGLRRSTVMRKIILPQAMRLIIPPAANNFIGLLKATALISVISGSDLLTEAQVIYTDNFQVISLLIVAAIWYLVLVGLATLGQQYLERKFSQQASSGRRRLIARAEEAL